MELKFVSSDVMSQSLPVLIIPYGIEIRFLAVSFFACFGFNHTLWN